MPGGTKWGAVEAIYVPREDANDDGAVLIRWLVPHGHTVVQGQAVCEMETTKTVFTVYSPAEGPLHHALEEGQEVAVGSPLGTIGGPAQTPLSKTQEAEPPRMTRQAKQLIEQYNLDPTQFDKRGILTADDVRAVLEPAKATVWTRTIERQRVLLLGGGSVAYQAVDILQNDRSVELIGCLDDDATTHGKTVLGVPVLGPTRELEARWKAQEFDAGLVTIGNTRLDLRKSWFEHFQALGIPLVNAIDSSARLNRGAAMGQGNVLCSFVHLGVGARLGDNCFVAAHSNIDHHCLVGDHVFLGPGCLLSGLVTLEDEVLLGSGVVVQPNLRVGTGSRVASGAVLIKDVPESHAVKTTVNLSLSPL